ncbi:hypothetical protein ACYT84_14585 [Ralstonia solanacearum]
MHCLLIDRARLTLRGGSHERRPAMAVEGQVLQMAKHRSGASA